MSSMIQRHKTAFTLAIVATVALAIILIVVYSGGGSGGGGGY